VTAPPDDLATYVRPTGRFGREVRFLAETGSTNDIALEAARAGAAEGLVVLADRQTAGRGRLQRRWQAPAGSSLLLSVLFRPPDPFARFAGRITMGCGLSLVTAVQQVTGVPVILKWPNDLIHEGRADSGGWRKLAGMLSEVAISDAGKPEALIVGIGLNANLGAGELATLAPNAGSLSSLAGTCVSRVALLDAFLAALDGQYAALLNGEDPASAWSAHIAWLGQSVVVSVGDEVVRGEAIGVDGEGALLVLDSAGEQRRFLAGDVSLRPDVR